MAYDGAMTDFNTFLQSDEFKAYRKKQIEQVGMYIEGQARQMINGGADNAVHIDGALKMARVLIDLPERLVKDQGIMNNLRTQKAEDLAVLASFLIKRQMVDE